MNRLNIIFEKSPAEVIVEHLEAVFPNEGCGFFFGKEGKIRTVTHALVVENAKVGDQRRRFEIDPFDFVKAERFALEHNLVLLGVFHSHPNHPAIPSEHDLKQALPYFSYLIVSVMNRVAVKATSWRLNEKTGQFDEEKLLNHNKFLKSTTNV
ncbi:MAG: M67 family metallopeptidase [Bacteroidota bacterium]